MLSSKAVKSTAKMILKNNWTNSILICGIVILAAAVFYMTAALLDLPLGGFSGIILLASYIFVVSPLCLGALHCFWCMANEIKVYPVETFYYFTHFSLYLRAVAFTLKITARIVLFTLLFYTPYLIATAFTSEYFYETLNMATPIWILGITPILYILKFSGFAFSCTYTMGLMLPAFLLVTKEDMSVGNCIKYGINVGKRFKGNFAGVTLSFVGYILLSLLFVPLLLTAPYLSVSYIVTCRFAVAQYNFSVDKANEIPTLEI